LTPVHPFSYRVDEMPKKKAPEPKTAPARSKPVPAAKPAVAKPPPEVAVTAALPVDEPEQVAAPARPARRATAETMATRQRDISVSEFFTKNRHLLGFDNPAKALLTTVKEAVDNSLDACEEAGILPDLRVEIHEVAAKAEGAPANANAPIRYRVCVEDNGPGIVKAQIPKIFAKLLYGSKFHRLKQSRGQQGIGISAAGLYGQLTTGKPVTIVSKTGKGRPAFKIELRIDTKRNQPDVVSDETVEWDKDHGTRVEIELLALYRGGRTSVDAYLEQTVVANPHLALHYTSPKGDTMDYPRVSDALPREAQEIKPHPHGVELGMLLTMLRDSPGKRVKDVLMDDFSRVTSNVADQICQLAKVSPKGYAASMDHDDAERLHKALGQVKLMAPPASCVVPIGEELLIEGLKRRFKGAFYVSTTRPPSVYRGNPFVVEVGLAYGGDQPLDEPAEIMRFANRVPLQYQPKACAISESIYDTNWKAYGLAQPRGSLPVGPIAIVVHLASVWVPFTSEAKEAVAHYDELMREMKLAVQECGRKLGTHLRAAEREASEHKRLGIFQRYIPEVSAALGSILGTSKDKIQKAFTAALPNFVKIVEEGNGGGLGGSGGSAPSEPPPPPPSMPPPPESEHSMPPAAPMKGKKKRAEQLSLI
jgi:DNA topoisomerase-6 subunit B